MSSGHVDVQKKSHVIWRTSRENEMKLNWGRKRDRYGILFIYHLAAQTRNAFPTQQEHQVYWIMKLKVAASRPGVFLSRLPMTELAMRHLNRGSASSDVPTANLAWRQTTSKYRRITRIKLIDYRSGRSLQYHPRFIRIVYRVFCENQFYNVHRRSSKRTKKGMC